MWTITLREPLRLSPEARTPTKSGRPLLFAAEIARRTMVVTGFAPEWQIGRRLTILMPSKDGDLSRDACTVDDVQRLKFHLQVRILCSTTLGNMRSLTFVALEAVAHLSAFGNFENIHRRVASTHRKNTCI
jgi:hypothetical protein